MRFLVEKSTERAGVKRGFVVRGRCGSHGSHSRLYFLSQLTAGISGLCAAVRCLLSSSPRLHPPHGPQAPPTTCQRQHHPLNCDNQKCVQALLNVPGRGWRWGGGRLPLTENLSLPVTLPTAQLLKGHECEQPVRLTCREVIQTLFSKANYF